MLFSNFFLVAMASLALAKPVEKNPEAAGRAASILGAVLMPRYSCAATCGSSADCQVDGLYGMDAAMSRWRGVHCTRMFFTPVLIGLLAASAYAFPADNVDEVAKSLEARQSVNSDELESGACLQVTFIFARASTESGNMGATVGPQTCSALKRRLGSSNVACQGIGAPYYATLGDNALPRGTSDAAIAEASRLFKLANTQCPDTIVVTGGYSQGTAVIAASLSDLSQQAPDVAGQVAGAILYGYTRNQQNGGRIPNYPTERTKVFCAAGDLVCKGTLIVLAPHFSYGVDVDEAAEFLAQRVQAAVPSNEITADSPNSIDNMGTCGTGTRHENYNLPLHVGALFIILGVSAGACALPLMALKVPQLHIPPKALFVFRHFGTGVLIATAFVHLFPTAFVSLTDPCLAPFFNEQYPALAGAISLAAVFIITIAEMIFSPGRSLCSGPEASGLHDLDSKDAQTERTSRQAANADSLVEEDITPAQATPQFGRTRSGRSHSVMKTAPASLTGQAQDSHLELDGLPDHTGSIAESRMSEESLGSTAAKEAEQQRKKLTMQCMLLECGILFHSVFIGMALAVAVGSEQVILLIAIAFHQTFEGLALGSRIAAVGWNPRALQPWLMALAYGCTTPLGQALGIATRNLYSPDSETGLTVVGTMNAISAGLLTYTSLVDLLSEDFLSDHSWKTMRGNKRIIAMSLVFLGAFCMSLIGAWA
ncbi:hypothetical protein AC578_3231 [Pseudocercospora eumusae]|uniref:Cutinase n=1 Tax=Pseudocercospora eumusae TaxID=321146 RepID=A0A139H225_9PEZI|nr:hypothetical protein AC578_3231 [Pseudocercospora eumusae]